MKWSLRCSVVLYASINVQATNVVTVVTFHTTVHAATGLALCTPAEWATIQSTLSAVVPSARRQLQSPSSVPSVVVPFEPMTFRSLRRRRRRCTDCDAYCLILGDGCAASNRRRQLQNETAATSCAHVPALSTALDAVRDTVSLECQGMWTPVPPTIQCDTAVPCGIDHVSVWNAHTDRVVVEHFPTTGGVLCRHTMDRSTTFRAVTNFQQGLVHFTVQGSAGMNYTHTEQSEPYFLFANWGNDVYGEYFPPGDYTMTITSDDITQTYTFAVTDQC